MGKDEFFQVLLTHLSITKPFSCYLHDDRVTEGLSGTVCCLPQLKNGFFKTSHSQHITFSYLTLSPETQESVSVLWDWFQPAGHTV